VLRKWSVKPLGKGGEDTPRKEKEIKAHPEYTPGNSTKLTTQKAVSRYDTWVALSGGELVRGKCTLKKSCDRSMSTMEKKLTVEVTRKSCASWHPGKDPSVGKEKEQRKRILGVSPIKEGSAA